MERIYRFSVGTNNVGSDVEDELKLEFEDDLTEEQIESQVEEIYLDWRNNYLDGGWTLVK